VSNRRICACRVATTAPNQIIHIPHHPNPSGHDHFYSQRAVEPHGTLVVKSGTDFRELSVITVELPAAASEGSEAIQSSKSEASGGGGGDEEEGLEAEADELPPPPLFTAVPGAEDIGEARARKRPRQSRPRPRLSAERVAVASAGLPEDPEVAAIGKEYSALMGSRMDTVIGASAVDLDGRFGTVRVGGGVRVGAGSVVAAATCDLPFAWSLLNNGDTSISIQVRRQESNLANFLCDILRRACSADVVLLNGGTFR
jgi:hypothetical protein